MENTKSLRLFSKETLDSIVMSEIYGGDTPNNCNGGNCSSGCESNTKLFCGIEVNLNIGAKCKEGCKDNTPES